MRTITTITTALLALALVTACTPQAEELAAARPVPLMLTATLAQATTAQPTRAAELPSAGRTTVPIALTAGQLPITMSSLPGASAATTMPEPVTKQYALGAIPDNPAATLTPVVSGAAGTLVAPNPGAYTFAVEPAKVTAKIMQTNVPTPLNLRVQMNETQLTVNPDGTLSSDLDLAPTTAGMRLVLKTDTDVEPISVLSILSGEEAPMQEAVDAPAATANTASRIVALTGTGTYAVAFGMLPPATAINAGDLLATITTKTHGSSITKTLALLAPATLTLAAGQMVTYTVHVGHSVASITGVSIDGFASGNGTGGEDLITGVAMADGSAPLDPKLFNDKNPVWVITGVGGNNAADAAIFGNVKTALTALNVISGGALISYARIDVILPDFAGSIVGDAFKDCKALASISAPKATNIGDNAFANCSTFVSVNLPVATSIGKQAFSDCKALTTISLPAATGIGNYAFANCTALTTISLPAATSIGERAFNNCFALTRLELTQSTAPITMHSNAFENINTGTGNITLVLASSNPDMLKTIGVTIDAVDPNKVTFSNTDDSGTVTDDATFTFAAVEYLNN